MNNPIDDPLTVHRSALARRTPSRLPNRYLLWLLDRFEYPLIGLLTIVTAFLAAVAATSWPTATATWALGIVLWMLVSGSTWQRDRVAPSAIRRLDPKDQWTPSIALMVWSAILYLMVAPHVLLVNLLALAPIFVPPFLMVMRRRSESAFKTPLVVGIALAVIIIIAIGPFRAIHISTPSLADQVTAGVQRAPQGPWWSNTALYSLILWGFFGPLYMYFLIRRDELELARSKARSKALSALLSIDDPWALGQEVAEILVHEAGLGKRVVIMQFDKDTDTLRVVAASPAGAQKAIGYSPPKGKSIARRAIRLNSVQIVGDVNKDLEFDDGGLPRLGSELVAPIRGGRTDAPEPIGTLHIQEDWKSAFSLEDADRAQEFADVISALEIDPTREFTDSLRSSLESLSLVEEPDQLVSSLLGLCREKFPQAVPCYYRLAVASGVPISGPHFGEPSLEAPTSSGTIGRGLLGFRDPGFFASAALLRQESDLQHWLADWDQRFIRHMSSDPSLQSGALGFGSDFQEKEGVKSMCFLPIGNKQSRLGALLLFSREPQLFTSLQINRVRTFAREIHPLIAVVEVVHWMRYGFARPRVHMHRILGEVLIGRGTGESLLDQAAFALRSHGEWDLEHKVKLLSVKMKNLKDLIKQWHDADYMRFNRAELSFWSELDLHLRTLQDVHRGAIATVLDDEGVYSALEQQTPSFKVALMVIIEEAAKNALWHGKASQVTVMIRRARSCIELEISDDGAGFNPVRKRDELAASDGADSGGIFALDELCQVMLGAEPINWMGTKPGEGTRLTWRIPVLVTPTSAANRGG